MTQETRPAQGSSSILQKRSFLHLRRRSDVVWFVGGLLSMGFSTSVFVYKFRYEAPAAVDAAPAAAAVSAPPAAEEPALPVPEKPAPARPKKPAEEAKALPPAAPRKEEPRPQPAPKPKAPEKVPVKEAVKPPVKPVHKEAAPPKAVHAEKRPAAPLPEPPAPPRPAPRTFISMSPDGWRTIKDGAAGLQLSEAGGPSPRSRALVLDYDLGDAGEWVQAVVEGPFDLSTARALSFAYKGEGERNSVEVKLETAGGETFGKLIPGATGDANWTTAVLPLREFQYFWGGSNKTLNAQNIRKIYFAVSKKAGGKGKAGKLLVSEVSKVPF